MHMVSALGRVQVLASHCVVVSCDWPSNRLASHPVESRPSCYTSQRKSAVLPIWLTETHWPNHTFTLNSTYHWGMCPVLVFCSVRCIREGFITPFHLTYVWSLSSMWSEMGLEVLKSGVSLGASIVLDKRKRRWRQKHCCALTRETEILLLVRLLQYFLTGEPCYSLATLPLNCLFFV